MHWVRKQPRGSNVLQGRDLSSDEEPSDFDESDSEAEQYDEEYDEEMDYSNEDDEEDW